RLAVPREGTWVRLRGHCMLFVMRPAPKSAVRGVPGEGRAVSRQPVLAAGERQEGHLAGVLHGGGDLTLLLRGQAGDAAGTDLAAVGDELAKEVDVLVVHLLNAGGLERVLLGAAGLLHPRLLVAVVALHVGLPTYQLDLRTPGSSPRWAISRTRTRDRPNLRR